MATTTGCVSSAAISGAAKADKVVSPTAGLPVASASPRAAAMPTRSPVKLPGPTVTAKRSRLSKPPPNWIMTRSISGISASAWPRVMAFDSRAITLPCSVSSTAAAQASSAVSMARMRIQ